MKDSVMKAAKDAEKTYPSVGVSLARLEARLAALEAEVRSLKGTSSRNHYEVEQLLDEIARAVGPWEFCTSSLLQKAEMDAEAGKVSLTEALEACCRLNAGRLGQLLARIEGKRLRRVRHSREGVVWRITE